MTHTRWTTVCAVAVAASMLTVRAHAQLAPTGGHYAGRASDTGHAPGTVNASGGYAASLPLDLPAVRGGLPIPLQIMYGASGVGAAGLGWDLPFSYVRRDTSFARRRPTMGDNVTAEPRAQIALSFQGRSIDLVRRGRRGSLATTRRPLRARTTSGPCLEATGPHLHVHGAPRSRNRAAAASNADQAVAVDLEYDVVPSIMGAMAIAIDLVRVRYNAHPTPCAKHESRSYGNVSHRRCGSRWLMTACSRARTISTI